MAVLKKHCSRLCQCLPQDYMKTIGKIKKRAVVPDGLIRQLMLLPSPKHVNHHIIAAMMRPLTNEAGVLGFCDLMEFVLDDQQSKVFIENLRNGMYISFVLIVSMYKYRYIHTYTAKGYILKGLYVNFILTEILEAMSVATFNFNTTTVTTSTSNSTTTTTTTITTTTITTTTTATTTSTTSSVATTVNVIKKPVFMPINSAEEQSVVHNMPSGTHMYICICKS